MASHEYPEKNILKGVTVPEDISAELSSELYHRVAGRLWDLGIVPIQPPKIPDVFSRPLDSERTMSLVAFGQQVIDSSGAPIVTQRLIVNTRLHDSETGLPSIVVDDFVLDHSDETISYKRSEIPAIRSADGAQILVGNQTGPYINFEDMELEIIFGSDYERHHFDENGFRSNNVVAEDALLGTLNILSEAHRETIAECHYHER